MGNSIQRQLLITIFIFSFEYFLMLDPYTSVRLVRQGLFIGPHNLAIKVRTLSIVRHPELTTLYASALNHVLGQ